MVTGLHDRGHDRLAGAFFAVALFAGALFPVAFFTVDLFAIAFFTGLGTDAASTAGLVTVARSEVASFAAAVTCARCRASPGAPTP